MELFARMLLAVAALVGSAAIAHSENVDLSTVPRRQSVQLTIYNSEDLTLVRETRVVTFKQGTNPLQFSWANTLIDPTSVELKFLTGADKLEVLDTTCCGMAGMFGYTKDRFDLSMKIGELGVLPAARGIRDEDVMVAPGTSCRHQIHDGAHARAIHPIEFAARAMGLGPDAAG